MNFAFHQNLTTDDIAKIRKLVKEYSKIKATKSLVHVGLDWLTIVGLSVFCHFYFSIGLYLITIFVVGARMHALTILGHEAVHGRLFLNKELNMVFSNLFVAYPLFYQNEVYRDSHLKHHRHTNTDKDPDRQLHRDMKEWQFPMPKMRLLKYFVMDIFLRGAFLNIERLIRYSGRSQRAEDLQEVLKRSRKQRLIFYTFLAIALHSLGLWNEFFLFWVVPLLVTLPFFLRLRNIGDHYGLSWKTELQSSRNIECPWFERFFFAPHRIGYHLVHHLYPTIPFYNLKKMHLHLSSIPFYNEHSHHNSSYLIPFKNSVIAESTRV